MKIEAGAGKEDVAIVVPAVAFGLEVIAEVGEHRVVMGVEVLHRPQQHGIGTEGIEGLHRRPQIAEDGDDDVGEADPLERMLAGGLHRALAEEHVIIRHAAADPVEVGEEGVPIKAVDQFVGECVVAGGEVVANHLAQAVEVVVAVDAACFESVGPPVDEELQREEDDPQEKVGHLENRAQEDVVEPMLLVFEGLVDVAGEEREGLHRVSAGRCSRRTF